LNGKIPERVALLQFTQFYPHGPGTGDEFALEDQQRGRQVEIKLGQPIFGAASESKLSPPANFRQNLEHFNRAVSPAFSTHLPR